MVMLAPVVFLVLLFITAPYGRYNRQGWGASIPGKAGWLIMEAPASLLMLAVILWVPLNLPIAFLFALWQVHYFHRAFIYPFTLLSGKPIPIVVVLMAITFNSINAYLNGYHFVLHSDWYRVEWLFQLNFIGGLLLFGVGFYITKKSDRILRELRAADETAYKIPHGFLFRWVSCPNYLGECIQWFGWALMTLSPAAWVFLLWTIANLLPRAISHQHWYRLEFSDYPPTRKAIIPFLI